MKMDRIVEKISEEIIHVTYSGLVEESEKICEQTPVDFKWKEKTVIRQTKVCFTPHTLYRYEAKKNSLSKKMTANGEVSYAESMNAVPNGSSFCVDLCFEIGDDELLLGMGQFEDGIMDHRDHTEYLYESNMRIAIPFLVTTGHYGILIDSESSMIFSSSGSKISFTIDSAHILSYYVFLSENISGLVKCYYRLTGMPSMLPRWAFGYIQSKERYKTGNELLQTASRFRKGGIPIDCIVQDWYSWEEGLWGEKKFDKKRYPDLPGTVRALHDMDIHFCVSIWPNMSPESENYSEFARSKKLLPNSNLYDAYDEEAKDIYWGQVCEEIMAAGTDALWCDNAEPFSDADWSGETKKAEKERYDVVTETSKRSMDWERLNSYGLYHAKGIYENWRKTYPQKRVVNLTRSGYTGIQSLGAILWSGDITATFDTLRRQIVEGIRAGLSGIPYWTLDAGGFFVVNDKYENRGCNDTEHKPLWFWKGDYNDGVSDMGYRELYVRWLEFAAFLPVFRSHGTDTPREPWHFGKKGDAFYDAILSSIKMRYRLMPYIYSLGAAAHFNGEAIMRSLIMDYPEDKNVYSVTDEYLFGPSLLVAPVYTPMYYLPDSVPLENTKKSRDVYLPAGNGWYNLHTGKYHEGGSMVSADAPIDRIPVFVREGSVIPLSSDMDFADERGGNPDLIRVYEGRDGKFTLYLDEGDGYGFENGEYSLADLTYSEKNHSVSVSKKGNYPMTDDLTIEYIKRPSE